MQTQEQYNAMIAERQRKIEQAKEAIKDLDIHDVLNAIRLRNDVYLDWHTDETIIEELAEFTERQESEIPQEEKEAFIGCFRSHYAVGDMYNALQNWEYEKPEALENVTNTIN